MKKGRREHKVPLCDAAMAILDKQAAVRTNDYVFPGSYGAKHVGQNLLLQVLARLDRSDLTVHGFRSTFSVWVSEETGFDRNTREMALAHKIPNAVEAAYRRGDLFDKRRRLAEAWRATSAAPRSCASPLSGNRRDAPRPHRRGNLGAAEPLGRDDRGRPLSLLAAYPLVARDPRQMRRSRRAAAGANRRLNPSAGLTAGFEAESAQR